MKRVLKSLVFAMILTLLFGLTSQAAVKNITIRKPTKKSSTVVYLDAANPKREILLQWTCKIKGTKNNDVKVKTSNKKVVGVKQLTNRKATLVVKKAGTATVTVYDAKTKKVKDTLKVTVKQKVTEIDPKYQYVYVEKGKTAKLKYTVLPKNASSKKVKFKSKNTAVATVSSSGTVKGKKAGTAEIVATAQDGSKTKVKFYITVGKKSKKVTSVSASASRTTLTPGETTTITASVAPSNAINKNVRYKSSNESVATVSAAGVITAVRPGTATIKVTANDGSRKSASVTITVKQASKVLGVDASKFGTDYTVNTSIKWTDPAAAESAFDKLASVAAVSSRKLTYKITLNGKTYDMVLDGNGVTVGGKSFTEFTANSLVNSTMKRTITAERFAELFGKTEAMLKSVTTASKFGNAVVTSGTSTFSIEDVQLNYNKLTFKLDGAAATATLDKGQITVVSDGSLDKAVAAVSAVTGGIFTAK